MENTNMQMAESMPVVSQAIETPEPAMPTLADVIGEQPGTQEQVQTPEASTDTVPAQEPGWYAKRRAKDRAEWDAKMAPVLSQMSKLQEYYLSTEADKLVSSGKINDREIALEYLRNKEGIPAPETPAATTPPRDERGRFTSPNTPAQPQVPAEIQQRANELFAQAKALQKFSGVDVLSEYRSNPEYAEKVNSGEWDMADVLTAAQKREAPAANHAPAPVRASNGSGIGSASFMNMTSEAFAKVNEELRKGGRINMKTY